MICNEHELVWGIALIIIYTMVHNPGSDKVDDFHAKTSFRIASRVFDANA